MCFAVIPSIIIGVLILKKKEEKYFIHFIIIYLVIMMLAIILLLNGVLIQLNKPDKFVIVESIYLKSNNNG